MVSIIFNSKKIHELVEKYGGSVPRYTSYPTAPEWKQPYNHDEFLKAIDRSNQQGDDYSLYLHIPFCETQCYYCGCNVVISKEHGIEKNYLDYLKQELEYLGSKIDKKRRVVQMAWGGGTPTFLTPAQIKDLYEHIAKHFNLYTNAEIGSNKNSSSYEYSIEIDPRVTSREHLETLHELGFNRLSMGVQDFDEKTQVAINRLQSFELVADLLKQARDIGFKSVNFDLVYGLPHQTLESFSKTIKIVRDLDPERIALFNYAHIPSMLPFQKKYILDDTLPSQEIKLAIFDKAIVEFAKSGYEFIGMDHFAKPDDELAIAAREKTLYRNFQGFTTHSGCDLYGAGITAISDVSGVYKQNHKKLNDYYARQKNELENFGAEKFMKCSEDDIARRDLIKELMCNHEAMIDPDKFSAEIDSLSEFVDDGLLEISSAYENDKGFYALQVTELGKFFVRNIASKFDNYLVRKNSHKIFSRAL